MVNKQTINAEQIAIICATKDRPDKVRVCSRAWPGWKVSLVKFLLQTGDIILGHWSRSLLGELMYRASTVPGRVRYCSAIMLIRCFTKISVLFYISMMILRWNQPASTKRSIIGTGLTSETGKPLVGMALNVVNLPKKKDNLLRWLAIMRVEPMGRVWSSGFASPHVPVPHGTGEIRDTSWLVGGATLWSRNALATSHPLSFPTRWAVCEDVIFSYPFSHKNRLVVCGDAVAQHNDSYVHHSFAKKYVLWGKSGRHAICLGRLNNDLSRLAFFWSNGLHMFGYLACAVLVNKNALGTGIGVMLGLMKVLFAQFTGRSHIDLARDLAQ